MGKSAQRFVQFRSCHLPFFTLQAAASEPVSQGPGCTLGKTDSSSAKGSDPMGFFMGFTFVGMVYITKDW
jgi:hypothetical protein